MSAERPRSFLRNRRVSTTAVLASVVLAAVGVSSCSNNNPTLGQRSPSPTATAPTTHNRPTAQIMPDLSGFLKKDTTDTCLGGHARPCAVLIRAKPELDSTKVNVEDPPQKYVKGPFEAYGDNHGDSLTAVCEDANGDSVTTVDMLESSTTWFGVITLEKYVLDPTLKKRLDRSHGASMIGYVSAEWISPDTQPTNLEPCPS